MQFPNLKELKMSQVTWPDHSLFRNGLSFMG